MGCQYLDRYDILAALGRARPSCAGWSPHSSSTRFLSVLRLLLPWSDGQLDYMSMDTHAGGAVRGFLLKWQEGGEGRSGSAGRLQLDGGCHVGF